MCRLLLCYRLPENGLLPCLLCIQRQIFGRHPTVSSAVAHNMADAGERQVRAAYPQAVLLGKAENTAARGLGGNFIRIKFQCNFGMLKLDGVAVYHIAPNQQAVFTWGRPDSRSCLGYVRIRRAFQYSEFVRPLRKV